MSEKASFRQALMAIHELADGRRHYDGTDDYTCFDALGDVRALAAEALSTCPAGCSPGEAVHEGPCGSFDPTLSFDTLISSFQALVEADEREVQFTYKNWKGQTALRHAKIDRIWWGKTEWHPVKQWLVDGWDCDKEADRVYTLKDMTNVEAI